MKFRTEIEIPKSSAVLSHRDSVLFLGSCFAEAMENQFSKHGFSSWQNPLGISYNPISLHKLLCRKEAFDACDFFKNQGIYYHDDLHGSFSGTNPIQAADLAQEGLANLNKALNQATTLVITYGTAWVYERIENKRLVNNCHKQAAKLFKKRLLGTDEIVQSWEETRKILQTTHPQIEHFIFTLSPIRHLKDGLEMNQLSKSTLRLALDQIASNEKHSYFPSYEIVLDELRDYRFYEADLVHPNSMAQEFIWEKFSECFFQEQTQQFNRKIESFYRSAHHRPFHPNSQEHLAFLDKLIPDIKTFEAKSGINLSAIRQQAEDQLLPQ